MRASRRCIFVPPSEFVLSLESLVAIASSNEAFAYASLITLRLATGFVNTRTHSRQVQKTSRSTFVRALQQANTAITKNVTSFV